MADANTSLALIEAANERKRRKTELEETMNRPVKTQFLEKDQNMLGAFFDPANQSQADAMMQFSLKLAGSDPRQNFGTRMGGAMNAGGAAFGAREDGTREADMAKAKMNYDLSRQSQADTLALAKHEREGVAKPTSGQTMKVDYLTPDGTVSREGVAVFNPGRRTFQDEAGQPLTPGQFRPARTGSTESDMTRGGLTKPTENQVQKDIF